MLWIWFDFFILAVKRGDDELLAELEQVGSNLAACERERVDSIQVDMRCYRGNDTRKVYRQYSAFGMQGIDNVYDASLD